MEAEGGGGGGALCAPAQSLPAQISPGTSPGEGVYRCVCWGGGGGVIN